MKIKIAAFIAGILGILGVLLFLIAFGTDYWLLATEACGGFEPENNTLHTKEDGKGKQKNDSQEVLTFHHEGFFWRCWFFGDYKESIWTFWFTSQGHPKYCMNGYLFPMPIALRPYPHPSYDATAVTFEPWKSAPGELQKADPTRWVYSVLHPSVFFSGGTVYRGFWTAFIVLAVTASLVGGFLLVCGVPFINARFYKVGGGFLITAGILFALLIFLFVMWKEFAADLAMYILLERKDRCEDEIPVKVYYGWSFIFAAAGVPLVLLSGLLFYLVGYSILKELE